MPRARTSVATSTSAAPSRKLRSAFSRWRCVRLPWMGAHAKPALRSLRQMASARCLPRVNTMTRSAPSRRSTSASTAFFASGETPSTNCSIVCAGVPLRAIFTWAGSRTSERVIAMASSSSVAEKSKVCRSDGVRATIFFTAGRKPMSSMRSASSSTSTPTWSMLAWPESRRSCRRPGVATSTSQPRASAWYWGSYATPPTSVTVRCPVCAQMVPATSSICWASSRVGVMTSMSGPSPAPACPRRLSVGSRNASVLPVPVCAAASTSLPASTRGMACACTGVGCVWPISATASSTSRLRPS